MKNERKYCICGHPLEDHNEETSKCFSQEKPGTSGYGCECKIFKESKVSSDDQS